MLISYFNIVLTIQAGQWHRCFLQSCFIDEIN